MKTTSKRIVIAAALLSTLSTQAMAKMNGALSLQGRYHVQSSVLKEQLPYEDGDYSGMLALELQENYAYWQLGVDYAPSLDSADTVITPQLNLMFGNEYFASGVGILDSYITGYDKDGTGETKDEWSDIYYQFLVGIHLPISAKWELTGSVAYPFLEWGSISDFEWNDLEYLAGLRFNFE